LTFVIGITILPPGASADDEMTPPRCSFLRALHDQVLWSQLNREFSTQS
jgi:hypothetical protein